MNQDKSSLFRTDPEQQQAIEDHKWFLSERLGRDVGHRVAALDYLTNVQERNTALFSASAHSFRLGEWFFGVLEQLAATRGYQHLAAAQMTARSGWAQGGN